MSFANAFAAAAAGYAEYLGFAPVEARRMTDCPKCDCGFDGVDEDGRLYSCYFCGETGAVTVDCARHYWRDRHEWDYEAALAAERRRAAHEAFLAALTADERAEYEWQQAEAEGERRAEAAWGNQW